MKLFLPLAVSASLLATTALAEVPRVVATIKPIHALVASVMGDLGDPTLIVRGGASPHTYSLRPSDAAALEGADIVFWTGHGMELFLEGALDSLAVEATVVPLSDSPGVTLLPIREGGLFETHAHDDHDEHDDHGHNDRDHDDHDDHGRAEHDDHGHAGEMDMHFWLDPHNAVHLVDYIAATLAAADPDNADAYAANAAAEAARLNALSAEIEARLAPVRDVPFIVFHDAYQYFEARFGLAIAGSITVTPDTLPGAARIAEIRERLTESEAACVFAEPQFEPAIVATLIEGTSAGAGTLDPEGSTLTEGPGLYAELIGGLADGLVDCLSAAAP